MSPSSPIDPAIIECPACETKYSRQLSHRDWTSEGQVDATASATCPSCGHTVFPARLDWSDPDVLREP
jgi:endogenous inhibitor of DNA gyrase (YacG/DUF329 family)